jgi:metal transporter CNNM
MAPLLTPAILSAIHASGLSLCSLPNSSPDFPAAVDPSFLLDDVYVNLDDTILPCLTSSSSSRTLEEELATGSSFYLMLGGVVGCLLTAFMAAGLTMGLLSIDPLEMAIKVKSGTPKEARMASAIIPLLSRHHLLLVTLLLFNAAANEALPLFLDKLVPSYIAILLSVTIVLFVGEIIPSAIFTGPNQLEIAYLLSPFVKLLMLVASPLTYPIAFTLDKCLGHDAHGVTKYNRRELSALVQIQYEENRRTTKSSTPSDTLAHSVNYDEMNIIQGALGMTTKTAGDVLTPWKKVFALESTTVLNENTIADVYSRGHSRIPIFEPIKQSSIASKKDVTRQDATKQNAKGRVCGFLLTRQLMVIDPDDERPINHLNLHKPLCVSADIPLTDLLNLFQMGTKGVKGGHLAMVCNKPKIASNALDSDDHIPSEAGIIGIVTLEDVIEELLQEQIFDEGDKFEIRAMARAKRVVRRWKKHVRTKRLERGEDAGPYSGISESERSVRGLVVGATRMSSDSGVSSGGGATRDLEAGFGKNKSAIDSTPLIPKEESKGKGWFGKSKK